MICMSGSLLRNLLIRSRASGSSSTIRVRMFILTSCAVFAKGKCHTDGQPASLRTYQLKAILTSLMREFALLCSKHIWRHASILPVGATLAPGKPTAAFTLRVCSLLCFQKKHDAEENPCGARHPRSFWRLLAAKLADKCFALHLGSLASRDVARVDDTHQISALFSCRHAD